MYYGFTCMPVDTKIAQNYLEYLHCPNVDFQFCYDYPCVLSEGDVVCTMNSVDLTLESITVSSAIVSFTPTTYDYIVELLQDSNVVDTKTKPTSPITYTGLTPATNYIVKLTQFCPGGESKSVTLPILTMPVCVTVIDITGTAEDVNVL